MTFKKNILLTFDYELFQGEQSGSVANCMLIPTSKILDILSRHKATAIFFIDMMYLCRLQETATHHKNAKTDFDLIERQIIEMAERGHYVFNHIHPHWLDAIYNPENNQWKLTDISNYSFYSLKESERTSVFETTMKLLNEILLKASKKKLPDGFRAGGLYIQPFSAFQPFFEKYKMQYDFSVLKGAKGELENNANVFDFSKVEKDVYRFSDKVETEDVNGTFTEYALRFSELTFFPRLLNSLWYRLTKNSAARKKYGDGSSTKNNITAPSATKFSSYETFSIESLNEIKLPIYLNEAVRNNYLHIISHPKLVSENNLKIFDRFLQKITSNGEVEFDFKKFKLS